MSVAGKRTRWRDGNAYRKNELRILQFSSMKDVRRALELFFTAENFDGMPYGILGGMTMLVTARAARSFRDLGGRAHVIKLPGHRGRKRRMIPCLRIRQRYQKRAD